MSANGAHPDRRSTPILYTVEDLATTHNFKRIGTEWHGPNPKGGGATHDGYILNDDGTSFDRKLNQRFTSVETAQNFGINPDEYKPVAWFKSENPRINNGKPSHLRTSPNHAPVQRVPHGNAKNGAGAKIKPVKTIEYDYREDGEIRFQTVRREYANGSKDFAQRRPDGAGGWIYNLKDVEPILYLADDLKEAHTVFVCEGEKAADVLNDQLKKYGKYGESVATTAPMGAGKKQEFYDKVFKNCKGKHVAIFPDADEKGRKHAEAIAQALDYLDYKAASLKIVELPNLPEKGDAEEYFENGGTLAELFQTIEQAPEAPHAPQKFRLVSIPELITRPDPTWRIHGVLSDGTNSLLAAPHASFKSFLVLDMALSVATGRKWCGRDVRQGHVVYICAEGASGMKARVLAWCHDRGEEWPASFHFVEDAVQIHDAADRAAFLEALGDIKPVLIVLDTLSLCALGLEENNSKDMNLFMADAKKVQDATGAHVMLVHHHSKAGGARGSTSIPAATQSEFEIKRERDSATLICHKQKDGLEFKPITFISRLVEYDTWRRKSSLVLDFQGNAEDAANLTANEKKVYDLLAETFGANGATSSTWWAVASENKIIKGTFYRALNNLVQKGKVDDGKDGKGGRGATYRPTELLEAEAAKEAAKAAESEAQNQSHCSNQSQSANETDETEKSPTVEPVSKSANETNETGENESFESEIGTSKPESPESLKVSNSLNETNETEVKLESLKVSPPFRGETNETDTCEHKNGTVHAQHEPTVKPPKKAVPRKSHGTNGTEKTEALEEVEL
jgi:5S rRNA maturation endonuclease (ribonuclease M5)/predicted transcriptional regulator